MPARTKFYGWQNLAVGRPVRTLRASRYDRPGEPAQITALFGPICYSNAPTVVQPSDGTITVNLPAPNCNDPQSGTSGWSVNTPGTATLVDSFVRRLAGGELAVRQPQRPDAAHRGSRLAARAPVYFEGWGGDTGSFTVGANTTNTEGSVRRDSHTISFRLGTSPFTIGATYGGCAVLSTKVIGDTTNGPVGTAQIDTPSNCPVGQGSGAARWFKFGTKVTVSTKKAGRQQAAVPRLGRHRNVTGIDRYNESLTFTLNASTTATASYGTNANCRPLTITVAPVGSLTLDQQFTLGENACAVDVRRQVLRPGHRRQRADHQRLARRPRRRGRRDRLHALDLRPAHRPGRGLRAQQHLEADRASSTSCSTATPRSSRSRARVRRPGCRHPRRGRQASSMAPAPRTSTRRPSRTSPTTSSPQPADCSTGLRPEVAVRRLRLAGRHPAEADRRRRPGRVQVHRLVGRRAGHRLQPGCGGRARGSRPHRAGRQLPRPDHRELRGDLLHAQPAVSTPRRWR